jgi:hypothetical protein
MKISIAGIGHDDSGKKLAYKGANDVNPNVITVFESTAPIGYIQSAKEKFGVDNSYYHS